MAHMAIANKKENFVFNEPCNWCKDSDADPCGATPTTYIGDIYYACESHRDEMIAWLEDE